MQARRRRAGHLGERGVGDIGSPGKLGGAEVVGLVLHPGDLVRRHAAEDRLRALRHGLHDDQVAETLEQVLDEAARVVAGLDDAIHGAEHGGGVGGGNGLDDVVQEEACV